MFAKKERNDEFYTQYKTAELLLKDYKQDLKDKVIYCNCDHDWSNFVKFLKDHKNEIQYKALYNTGITSEFDFGDEYVVGDFRHWRSVELLKKSDVIITNPPFSLIGQWHGLIKKYNKYFIAIAPNTFVARNIVRQDFVMQKTFINQKKRYDNNYIAPNGNLYRVNTYFYTNIKKIKYNHQNTSQKCYMKDCSYRFYDNTEILAITNAKRMPIDYNGLFTLSIGQCWHFDFDKYELICFTTDYHQKLLIDGKEQFTRILCKKKSC